MTEANRLVVEYRAVESLIPYVKNARTHSEAQVAQIAASIREFGWTNPVLVVEEQEYPAYLRAVDGDSSKLLVLDTTYKAKYELCDELGLTRSTGSGPARNFIWEHSISEGHAWHWVMDDNIRDFKRMNNSARVKVSDGGEYRAMEDFVLRYKNIAMAGPNYQMFAIECRKLPPFVVNTRIYSCNLIRNDVPFRWRGRYNEDTILSLDMLKAGWCTVQFNAFLQHKTTTQVMGGGNSTEFYWKEGTRAKSEMLARVHPDVARVVFKYGRVHHFVDYTKFKGVRLIRRDDIEIPQSQNEYGMRLKRK